MVKFLVAEADSESVITWKINKKEIKQYCKKMDEFISYNRITTDILIELFSDDKFMKLYEMKEYFKCLVIKLHKIIDKPHLVHMLLIHNHDNLIMWMTDNGYLTNDELNKGVKKFMKQHSNRFKKLGYASSK